MMSRLVVLACALTVVLALPVVGVRLIGTVPDAPIGVSLLNSGACLEPCWHGIRPGETSLREVADILRSDYVTRGDFTYELCWALWADMPGQGCVRKSNPEPGGPIDQIELDLPDDALPLGYVIAKFGEPLSARLCVSPNKVGTSLVTAYLYFRGNVEVMAHDPLYPDRLRLDANMSVTQVRYYPYDESWYSPGASNWQVFTWQPTRKYGCS